jgi:uncharacterized membrane protein
MITFNETHLRTTVKSVLYRFFSVTLAISLTLAFGGTAEQAFKFGIASLLSGIVIFYVYDRIWIKISWKRDSLGKDAKWRTIIKSVLYRLIALSVSALFARAIWASTDLEAIIMATTQFSLNLAMYFITERIWNQISWGKVIVDEQINTV